ncbi:Botryococcus squalene synthase [Folsomia candida]|uniref:Botryococcus squalene synthase n=1 Tax=Folsomia candida TaxID=158441 RepID=A0A226EE66_FOLCA|nr:Botryococcus squalene synthase [Folsomia candida]
METVKQKSCKSWITKPREILALRTLIKLKYARDPGQEKDQWCYDMLLNFGEAFGMMCKLLPSEMQHFLAALYLALRVIDTIEDDVGKSYGLNPKEITLMQNLPKVRTFYLQLSPVLQTLVDSAVQEMARGMIKFLAKPQDQPLCDTFVDLEEYCYIVAGIAQKAIFSFLTEEGFELEENVSRLIPGEPGWLTGSISYSIFNQEANIIRDIADDTMAAKSSRLYWPKELVEKYVAQQSDLVIPANRKVAISCLNELIAHTLTHVVPMLEWLDNLKCKKAKETMCVFFLKNLATLAILYGNGKTFKYVLKPSVPTLAYLLEISTDFGKILQATKKYCGVICRKVGPRDVHKGLVLREVYAIMAKCDYLLLKC